MTETIGIFCDSHGQAKAWQEFLEKKMPFNQHMNAKIKNTEIILSPGFPLVLIIELCKENVNEILKVITRTAFNSHNEAWSGEVSGEGRWTFFKPRGYVNGSFEYLTSYLEGKTTGRTSPISI